MATLWAHYEVIRGLTRSDHNAVSLKIARPHEILVRPCGLLHTYTNLVSLQEETSIGLVYSVYRLSNSFTYFHFQDLYSLPDALNPISALDNAFLHK